MVAAEHGFHGRTMGSLALTGKPSKSASRSAAFGLTVRFVPFGDADALRAAVGPDRAGVFLEPMPGRGRRGARTRGLPARGPRGPATRRAPCWSLDEIQSGIGRTGTWFAHQAEGIAP